MKRRIIRASGAVVELEDRAYTFDELYKLVGCETFDVVNLRDGSVMLVDDNGHLDGKPVNPEATKLYHSVCVPGTTWPIVGDVAVVLDADFA